METYSVITPAIRIDEILIQSINTVLDQEFEGNIEHIIIFDKPKLELKEIEKFESKLESLYKNRKIYKIYYNEGKKGPSTARNMGLDKVSGNIVCFLDADDLWPKNYIKKIDEVYKNDITITAISVPGYEFGVAGSEGRISIPLVPSGLIELNQMIWNPIGCPSGFSLRWNANVKDVRFNEFLRFCEDYNYYLLIFLSERQKFYRLSDLAFKYRRSELQSTNKPKKDDVENSRAIFIDSINYYPFNKISKLKLKILKMHINYRFDKLKDISYYNLIIQTVKLAMCSPSWVFAQLRRKMQNRLGRRDGN